MQTPWKIERRMSMLFLLALALIVWQALRVQPTNQPSLEIATQKGEQLWPTAVPSWSPPAELSEDSHERLGFLEKRSVLWPDAGKPDEKNSDCKVFMRFSSQHWSVRPATSAEVRSWLERPETYSSWQPLRLPVQSFLDDDDGDGDPLDEGELRWAVPGADVEVFCRKSVRTVGDL